MIGQRKLKECTFEFKSAVLKKAALFPFFKQNGVIDGCMLLLKENEREVFYLPAEDIKKTPLSNTRINLHLHELRSISEEISKIEKKSLWHYDPWWLLDKHTNLRKEEVDILKKSNCVAELKSVSNLFFSLNEVNSKVVFAIQKNDTFSGFRKLSPALSPRVAKPSQKKISVEQKNGWYLAPFWKN